MTDRPREYRAFLVRIWPVSSQGKRLWRASVEDAHTGERRSFASLDDLFEFLRGHADAGLDAKEVKSADQL